MSFLFSWCSTGGLGVHSAVWWLPLLHLISIFSGPQLIRAPGPFGLVWLSLPHFSTGTRTLWPELNCPPPGRRTQLEPELNSTGSSNSTQLYNRSTPTRSLKSNFNRHQAEITVMQFTGHSLLVHQSMSVSWALPCPISSANFRLRDFLS